MNRRSVVKGGFEVIAEGDATTGPMPEARPAILESRGLSRSFGGIEVLSGVSLALRGGEVHAVIGENGAGKSTLMRLLSGHLSPSQGTVHIDGKAVTLADPHEAERLGIVLVHQEILLAPHLTVAQNIFMGREIRRFGLVDDRTMNRLAAEAVRGLGAALPPTTPVSRLSIAQRQVVQIARALQVPHRVVIFDEPTAALTNVETEALLERIRALRAAGVAVLYISHRLPEVAAIADRVSVLRDGRLVASREGGSLTPLDMAHLMVGRDMAQLFPEQVPAPAGAPMLEVGAFSVPSFAEDCSFSVRPGEILGFAGLIGAGRTELMEGLVGLRPARGTVRLDGKPVAFRSVADSLAAGVAYVTEDRKGKGLLLGQGLRVNLTLAALAKVCRGPLVDRAREERELDGAIAAFDIRARRRDTLAGHLSGGNQQKLLLGKTMLTEPRLVIIDEPTRGIDIGTKAQIYRFIATLAASGKAVIVVSSEMQELIGLCHRILVMRAGRIAGEVAGDAMTEAAIVVHATGVAPALTLDAA